MENRSVQWAILAGTEESDIPWIVTAEAEILAMKQDGIQLVQAKQDAETGMIDTAWLVKEHLIGMPGKLGTITVMQRCLHRVWSGRSLKTGEDADSETDWVYITEHGTVYHQYRSCTYLNVDLRYCTMEEVAQLRNPDGSKYYPCEVCRPSEQEYGVYIAVYGTRYHCTAACSSIRRLVRRVPLEQAEGRRPCSKCAGGEKG